MEDSVFSQVVKHELRNKVLPQITITLYHFGGDVVPNNSSNALVVTLEKKNNSFRGASKQSPQVGMTLLRSTDHIWKFLPFLDTSIANFEVHLFNLHVSTLWGSSSADMLVHNGEQDFGQILARISTAALKLLKVSIVTNTCGSRCQGN
jgi:hypothetical protein